MGELAEFEIGKSLLEGEGIIYYIGQFLKNSQQKPE